MVRSVLRGVSPSMHIMEKSKVVLNMNGRVNFIISFKIFLFIL